MNTADGTQEPQVTHDIAPVRNRVGAIDEVKDESDAAEESKAEQAEHNDEAGHAYTLKP